MIDFTKMWSGLDWGVIVLYFVFIIAVGLTMRRRASKNMKSYFAYFFFKNIKNRAFRFIFKTKCPVLWFLPSFLFHF